MRATGSRLSRRAASGKTVSISRASSRRSLCASNCGAVEVQRVREQNAGVGIGVLDAVDAEVLRHQPQRLGDRGAGLQPRNEPHRAPSAASNSAWCCVTSASITSPSASPSMTCGNL